MGNIVKCLILRHGKTEANIQKRYVGSKTDVPLCEEGKAEAFAFRETLHEILSKSGYEGNDKENLYLATSPMIRAKETASILFPEAEIHVTEGLREISFGEFEGKNYNELKSRKEYKDWIESGGTIAFPGGESRDDFGQRTLGAFYEILKQSGDGKTVAIVAHGGSLMGIMCTLTGENYYDFMVGNLEGFLLCFKFENGSITDLSYNRINSGSHS